MMKMKFAYISLLLLILSINIHAQFKVVGYIRPRADMLADLKKVDLTKITHLNLAFINPDTSGNFKNMPELDEFIKIAHQSKVKVLLSCGGGSRLKYYHKLLQNENRDQLVKNFVAFMAQYNFDGIDVDLEGDDIDENYEKFVVSLKQSLPKQKLLTAALAFYTRNRISDLALQQFDFINMMAYDKTGPWRPENPGQHSPISYAKEHLDYWANERNVAKDRLIVGVPFYGYGFGSLPEKDRFYREMGWKDIVAKFPKSMNDDQIYLDGDAGEVFYNGKKTIKQKTELALKKGGGIMIWQLMHDTEDENSLLSVIDQVIKSK
jgi:chitinase